MSQSMPYLVSSYSIWLTRGHCRIQDKNTGRIVPYKPNFVQQTIINHRVECVRNRRLIRQIALKSRKHGVSTEAQAWNYNAAQYQQNRTAMTFAQSDLDTKKIFKIARRIHMEAGHKCDASHRIVFNQGVGESTYECRTIGGHGGGRGDTVHDAHFSEAGFYEREVEQGAEAFSAMLNSVPMSLDTSVLVESTGYPGGKFHKMCLAAKDDTNGTWKLFFFPWFVDPTATWPIEHGWRANDMQREVQQQFGLSDEQIRWYALQFEQNVDDPDNPADIAKFRREFASTFEDCFLVATGRVFPQYSDTPITERGHVGTITIHDRMEIVGGLDYGAGGLHPNVHLWIAHDSDGPPRLIVDPSCKNTRQAFLMYCRDPDTGDPIKGDGWDDYLDAARYAITTRKMRGTVYIFKEYGEYQTRAHNDIARKIVSMTDRKPRATIASREEAQTNIDMTRFLGWPCLPWEIPAKIPGHTSSGIVEDGINHIAALLTGNVEWFRPREDATEAIMRKVEEARLPGRRPRRVWLTDKEKRMYDERVRRETRTQEAITI